MQYMTLSGWIQFLVFLVALAAITKPMGIYLLRVLDPDKEGGLGLLEKILGPVEWLVYKVARVNPKKQQNWKQYTLVAADAGHGHDRHQLRPVPHSGHPSPAGEHGQPRRARWTRTT